MGTQGFSLCDEPAPGFDVEYVCNQETGLIDQVVTVDPGDGTEPVITTTPTEYECSSPDDFEQVRECRDGTIHVVLNAIDDDGVKTELEAVDTGESCLEDQNFTTVRECRDGTIHAVTRQITEGATVVELEAVDTGEPCGPVPQIDVEVECVGDEIIELIYTDGELTGKDSLGECVDPLDFEQVRVCRNGTIHIVTSSIDADGDIAEISAVDTEQNCPEPQVDCVESQEWTYGIDNSGTRYQWADATYELTLSDGSTVQWQQTTASNGGWTDQLTEWAANIQAAADAAGLAWFVEPRFILNPDPTDLSGNLPNGTPSGLPGAPSVPIAVALDAGGMVWRYVNFQICPGQPVPVSAQLIAVDDNGGSPGPASIPLDLTAAGAVLGPIQKFFVCRNCGVEPVWYLEDGVTPATAGQIPDCWEPCGTLALTDAPPDRSCEFFFAEGCDNNNSDLTDDFTNLVTRRATVCNGEQISLNYFVPDPDDPTALVDYTLVGEFVDCATGEPVGLPVPPCDDFVSLGNMYQLGNVSGVLRNREWDIGPGLPGSLTTAEGEAIRTSFDFSQPTTVAGTWPNLGVNDTNNSPDVQDVQVIDGYVVVEEPITLRWTGGTLGYFALEVGECCGPLAFQFEGSEADGTLEPSEEYTFSTGIHAIRIWNIDERSNTSRNVEYSTDGGTTWTVDNTPPGIALSEVKPIEACIPIVKCIPSGAIVNPLTDEAVDPATLTACPQACKPGCMVDC